MKIDIVNIDHLVEVNKLPRITNPIYLEREQVPTQDGLFSYEIFGRVGSEARRFQFGHIDLKRKFLHPVIYKIIARSETKLIDVINGTREVSLDANGVIVDDPMGETGLSFLYNNWDKIQWRENDSRARGQKLDLIHQLKREEAFCSKWVVIPPFYRDLNLRDAGAGAQSTDEISPLYQKLIGLTNSIDDSEFDLGLGNNTERKIQEIIVTIYEILTSKLAKKNGLIRQGLLGKATENAVRAVISGPKLAVPKYTDVQVPYGYIGLPLYLVLYAFKPFIIQEMEYMFNSNSDIQIKMTDAENNIILDDSLKEITPKKIEKMINLFTKSHKDRFREVMFINDTDKELERLGVKYDDKTPGAATVTLADLLYFVANNIIKDKHVICTRYPVEDYRNVAPMKIKIMTTEVTANRRDDLTGELFENVPVSPKPGQDPAKVRWVDSARPQNLYLSGWGGDYDGRLTI